MLQSGERQADPAMGRYLMNLVAAVPKIDPEQFENMLTSNMKVGFQGETIQYLSPSYIIYQMLVARISCLFQDLLMVMYLSNLTRTQLTVTEKLSTL